MTRRGKDADVDLAAAGIGGGVAELPADPLPAAPPERSLAERLLDGCADGVVAVDHRGIVQAVNEAAARLLPGVRVGELLAAAAVAPLSAVAPAGDAQVELELAGRALTARRRPLSGGWAAWNITDVTERRARLDSLLAERARSRFLAAASRRLGLSLHPGRTARSVVELAVAELADAAVVALPAPGGRVEWFRGERGDIVTNGCACAGAVPAPVSDALTGFEPAPRTVLPDELHAAPWPAMSPVAAAAVVPLPGNGTPAGALVLVRRDAASSTTADEVVDEALAEEFAQRAGIALAAAALYAQQARTSAVLRASLLQPPPPTVAGMTFGAAYRPAEHAMMVGGDFYDVLPDATPTTFLLGDVCGKGVEAAVTTGQVRQTLHALRRLEPDPVRLLELLNETMLAASPPGTNPRFATLVLGTATPVGGGLRLELAGGGHLPPLVVRRTGVTAIELGGMLVGGVPGARVGSHTLDLAPGEACVFYTDGVTEARGGPDGRQEFGELRLVELLSGCHVMPAPAIAERVALRADSWVGGNGGRAEQDDVAVLVVQAPLAPTSTVTGAARRHLHSVHPTATDVEAQEPR